MKLHALESEHGEFDRLTVERFEALARKGADALVLAFRGGAMEKGAKPFPRDGTVDALGELGEMLTKAYADRVEMMARAAVAAVRGAAGPVPMALRKSGGPYIGPRGGKWADAEHTIPWKEGGGDGKQPESFEVHTHPAIFGSEQKGTYRVVKREGGKVRLSRHEGSDYGPEMPEESVKHFVNDLAGKVDLPKHGKNDAIDAVVTGQAEFLGKGDDGLAFRVGNQVVKVSTTVPYQPENPGHRTPAAAMEMLRKQVDTGNKLADMGVPGIQRSEFIQHGDKGFQIKPWVKIPDRLTRSQLDAVQQMVHAMHAKGYALNDEPQVGIDPASGDLVMFDVGKAAPDRSKDGDDSRFSDRSADFDRVAGLYRKHGEQFVNLREPAGEKAMRRAEDRMADWLERGAFGMARRHVEMASKAREKEITASVKGEASRNAELQILEWRTEDLLAQVDAAEKKAGKKTIAKGAHRAPSHGGGPFIGPRGGKWADAAHTVPWKEDVSAADARAHAVAMDEGGKHGKAGAGPTPADVPHVRVTVPISDLDAIDPADRGRVDEYAKRTTPIPAVHAGYNARSASRGKGKIYVANGNHRVAAAKARGDTHIEVVMPAADHGRWEGRMAKAEPAHRVPLTTHPVELGPPPARARKRFPHQGTIDFQGLRILVENREGSYRTGTDGDGHRWRVKMHAHYGEIAGTEGTDGDRLDVYVGDNADSPLAVVVHQSNPQTKAFDEDKVMLGFDTVADALAVYRKQYDRPGFYGGHEAMPIGRLLRWAKDPANRGTRVRKGSSFAALIRAAAGRAP